jgi:hypothetical protein
MKNTLKVIIQVAELCAENLNLERDPQYPITNSFEYDLLIYELGVIRMKARQILEEVMYAEVKE